MDMLAGPSSPSWDSVLEDHRDSVSWLSLESSQLPKPSFPVSISWTVYGLWNVYTLCSKPTMGTAGTLRDAESGYTDLSRSVVLNLWAANPLSNRYFQKIFTLWFIIIANCLGVTMTWWHCIKCHSTRKADVASYIQDSMKTAAWLTNLWLPPSGNLLLHPSPTGPSQTSPPLLLQEGQCLS